MRWLDEEVLEKNQNTKPEEIVINILVGFFSLILLFVIIYSAVSTFEMLSKMNLTDFLVAMAVLSICYFFGKSIRKETK